MFKIQVYVQAEENGGVSGWKDTVRRLDGSLCVYATRMKASKALECVGARSLFRIVEA